VGTYSSIFVAVPLLVLLKANSDALAGSNVTQPAIGEALREMVVSGTSGAGARGRAAVAVGSRPTRRGRVPAVLTGTNVAEQAKVALSHPPRPRKKKRR
jgi:hypothetical protein